MATNHSSPDWTGDLGDDCSAEWIGFLLRAEWMSGADWWWCIYDSGTGEQLASSNLPSAKTCHSGEAARDEAEAAARAFSYLKNVK